MSTMRIASLTVVVFLAMARFADAQSLILQAEDANLTGNASVSTDAPGYSGTGYVTGLHSASDTINWSFAGTPGLYHLVIRYRTPYGPKGFVGSFNGHGFSGNFPQTNSFASFPAGLVQVIAGSEHPPNRRWLELV